jgi:hypothetical protein
MMMSLFRQDPKIALSNASKDISTTHFRKSNMDGEVAFFEGTASGSARYWSRDELRAAVWILMAVEAL